MTPRRLPRALLLLPALLAAAGAMAWLGLRGKEDPARARIHADFERVLGALEAWRAEHGSLPEEGDLSFLVPRYLTSVPVDPWGHPYLYSSDGERPLLQSLGQDGLRGGGGPNEDHTQHDGHGVLRR